MCRIANPVAAANVSLALHVLIVLPQPVVARDIAEIVTELYPATVVHAMTDIAPACDLVASLDQIAFAFVHAGPAGLAQSGLGAALRAAGARVVLMGDTAERDGRAAGFAVLEQPFLPDMVLALIGATDR